MYERIDFMYRASNRAKNVTTDHMKLQIDLQYSDKEPAADWDGAGEDVEDENIQAMFDGPMYIGEVEDTFAPDTDATLAVQTAVNLLQNVHYFPPTRKGLDAFFPVTVVLTNASYDLPLITQVLAAADFVQFERFSMRIFFTVRNLTAQEKSLIANKAYGLVPLA